MIKRLRMKSCLNLRDIGGYETEAGFTKHGRFLRSDDVAVCTEEDIAQLQARGVKTVIDLRSREEADRTPNVFSGIKEIAYYHISIMDGLFDIAEMTRKENLKDFNLNNLYRALVGNTERMKELFTTIAKHTEGAILFHCTAGKDRTGVTAALLLMLAGVDKYDIMADYQVSYTYLMPKLPALLAAHPEFPQHILETNPDVIEDFYDYVIETYHSAEEYLRGLGLTKEEVETIKGGFLCTN